MLRTLVTSVGQFPQTWPTRMGIKKKKKKMLSVDKRLLEPEQKSIYTGYGIFHNKNASDSEHSVRV